jgi:NADPH-dependent FMN reductase
LLICLIELLGEAGATRVISFVNALRQHEINNIHTREKCRRENFKMAIKIAVILGSTRPGRNGEAVALWVFEIAKKCADAEFEFVDIRLQSATPR